MRAQHIVKPEHLIDDTSNRVFVDKIMKPYLSNLFEDLMRRQRKEKNGKGA